MMGTVSIGDSFQTCDLCKGPRSEDFYSMSAIKLIPGVSKRVYEYHEVCQTCWEQISVAVRERMDVNVAAARNRFNQMTARLAASASYDEATK